MIAMGQSLGLRVVAEGVETSEHLRALRTLGCPTAQGYLFSRPVPAAGIEQLAREGGILVAPEHHGAVARKARAEPSATTQERLVRSLLAELQRVTGLETTYLTRIDFGRAVQSITHVRNAGSLHIPEGLAVDWSDTVCRRALEQGVRYTDDVPATFPDSPAGKDLGLQTYLSVPLVNAQGDIEGTLCGASSRPVALGPAAVQVMERFAQIIAQGVAAPPARPAVPARQPAGDMSARPSAREPQAVASAFPPGAGSSPRASS
jgi:GAF domain-containing protein